MPASGMLPGVPGAWLPAVREKKGSVGGRLWEEAAGHRYAHLGQASGFCFARRSGPPQPLLMIIAWTTTATRSDAERLAEGAVEKRLAACAQIDGPVLSHYHWEGRLVQRRLGFEVSAN